MRSGKAAVDFHLRRFQRLEEQNTIK